MEKTEDVFAMLDLLERPAFCVKEGTILRINPAAKNLLLEAGTQVASLLVTGAQEYSQFEDGCLYLTVKVADTLRGADVTRVNGVDIFTLEQDTEQAELQAMALAAQELRQPLAGVMTVADRLFPIAAAEEDPALQDHVARINRGLFQILRIVSNMSDAYRYCTDTAPRMETRNITAVFEEFFANNGPLIAMAEIELKYEGPTEQIYGLVDTEKLERAVSNLLTNAVKHSTRGGVIEARLVRRNGMLWLTVKDGGRGVPPALRGSVYSRYRRSPGVEDGSQGIGLGMVLIRSAAAIHGGTVLMEQSEQTGSRVTMTMAIRQSRDSVVKAHRFQVDYAGERDHRLIEFAEILPPSAYRKEDVN